MATLEGMFLSESVAGWWSCDFFPEELLEAQGRHGLGAQAGRLCTAPARVPAATLYACVVSLLQLHHVGLDESTSVAGQMDLGETSCLSQVLKEHRPLTCLQRKNL